MPMGPTLKREYPEIQHTVRFWSQTDVVRYEDQSERLTFTDATIFEAFSFPAVRTIASTCTWSIRDTYRSRSVSSLPSTCGSEPTMRPSPSSMKLLLLISSPTPRKTNIILRIM